LVYFSKEIILENKIIKTKVFLRPSLERDEGRGFAKPLFITNNNEKNSRNLNTEPSSYLVSA